MRTVFNLLSLSACVSVTGLLFDKFILCEHLWCNWLACSAVNRKVAGSSPARCVPFLIILSLSACVSVTGLLFDKLLLCEHLWRNWLARSAVNRKVAGSSPARCVLFLIFYL